MPRFKSGLGYLLAYNKLVLTLETLAEPLQNLICTIGIIDKYLPWRAGVRIQ